MTETTQTTRYLVRADVGRHEPYASVMFSAKVIRGLVNDADRLAQAEALLRAIVDRHGETVCTDCECEVVKSGCLGDALHNEILKARAFLSDGGDT